MERQQAVDLIRILASVYIQMPFEQEQTREEYVKFFLPLNYNQSLQTVEKCKLNYKYCPAISDLYETYKAVGVEIRESMPTENCTICNGLGYIVHTKMEQFETASGKKIQYPYQYALYCTECTKGEQFKYNGREVKSHKSDNYTEPVDKYYNLDDLRAGNAFAVKKVIPIPQYVIDEAFKHGMDIRRIIRAG